MLRYEQLHKAPCETLVEDGTTDYVRGFLKDIHGSGKASLYKLTTGQGKELPREARQKSKADTGLKPDFERFVTNGFTRFRHSG